MHYLYTLHKMEISSKWKVQEDFSHQSAFMPQSKTNRNTIVRKSCLIIQKKKNETHTFQYVWESKESI